MDTLDGLKTIIAVVETGSFTAASERLQMSKALVSKYVGEVEDKLDVRLFNRTTRRISLTEAGKRYYQQARLMLDQYANMLDVVMDEQVKPKGLLRVSCPVTLGERTLAPLLPQFMTQYPDLKIDLLLGNRPVDMIEEGIDVRIRSGILEDSNMVARHIQTYPLYIVASPDYIKQHGAPQTLAELEQHNCIIDMNFSYGNHWPIIDKQGERHSIKVKSTLSSNSPMAIAEMVAAGAGIGLIASSIIHEDVTNGRLVQVMNDYTSDQFGLYAVYPHRKHVSQKVKCFVDFLMEKLAEQLTKN
ncbi:LysR family transcriptional regulator [Saccharobesus litoralis]|uniref:LysR family transcriptional regulator n=1 Tax=Saccharobesus litoralis TaxID=2172099 RepID=A0A2S0VQW7_9ALTE|nr:LysR family transcriptional regulator [Saccharobesus litoralis]AWB66594.1 LysR family transcriptional regulator [Saccharobesus litoralis]